MIDLVVRGGPFVTSISRESFAFTLETTRQVLARKIAER